MFPARKGNTSILGGGFNLFEKYLANRDENKKCLKPPASIMYNPINFWECEKYDKYECVSTWEDATKAQQKYLIYSGK